MKRVVQKSEVDFIGNIPVSGVVFLKHNLFYILFSSLIKFCSGHMLVLLSDWFFFSVIAEADLQKLSNALKILSETEKQLRISKNQTTWFTVALLQLSSVDYQSVDANDTKFSIRGACNGGELCITFFLDLLHYFQFLFSLAEWSGFVG